MNPLNCFLILGFLIAFLSNASAQEATITIEADQVLHSISPYLTGACLEDVNHEVYGGLYSQMIFGESFAEPAPQPPLKGFQVYEGRWRLADDGSLEVAGGQGSKIVWDEPAFSEGEASVEVKLKEANGGNAGLILKVGEARKGADAFTGYEVSLERPGALVLGRHRQNWEPIRHVPCDVPVNQWIHLSVQTTRNTLAVLLNGKTITKYEDTEHPLANGQVGLRSWQQDAQFRNFSVTTGGLEHKIPFEFASAKHWEDGVSGIWRPFRRGSAEGKFSIEDHNAFSGRQCQQITFTSGRGAIGIDNRGLNRWGMNFVKDKPYEGHLWVRAEKPTELCVALEGRDGAKVYAETRLQVKVGDWQLLDFTLAPDTTDPDGQFAVMLKQPGSVVVGYAFLEPGAWGRFAGLPVRKDVAEGLIKQGITVLRYGGSMVNAASYRWKNMVGPRGRRPPYAGTWYPYSSDGWGILDFLNFCEAAGFLGIPDLNVNETPQDMADFVQYLNGPTNTVWGARRLADGHPQPYGLKYLELGNEERVDDVYFQKFQLLAHAIWAEDSSMTIVVGDFGYSKAITNPLNFSGADSGITTLAAHQQILQLAKQNNRAVWFDVHVWTDGPTPGASLAGMLSCVDALRQIAAGADYKVVVFELNANNPTQRRALANALAVLAAQRDGRLPIVTSANCLQPDGQNDNGWDQGLLFLNPSEVWLQPPGYVTQMISRNYEPLLVQSRVESRGDSMHIGATRSEDGKTLVLSVVNSGEEAVSASIMIHGYSRTQPQASVEELAGPLNAMNTASSPTRFRPRRKPWKARFENGVARYDFQPHSFTVMKFN